MERARSVGGVPDEAPLTSTPLSDLSAVESDRTVHGSRRVCEVWDMLSESTVSVEISSEGPPVRVAFWNPEPLDGDRDELEMLLSQADAMKLASAIDAEARRPG